MKTPSLTEESVRAELHEELGEPSVPTHFAPAVLIELSGATTRAHPRSRPTRFSLAVAAVAVVGGVGLAGFTLAQRIHSGPANATVTPSPSAVPNPARDAVIARVSHFSYLHNITRIEAKEMHFSDLLAAQHSHGERNLLGGDRPELGTRLVWVIAVSAEIPSDAAVPLAPYHSAIYVWQATDEDPTISASHLSTGTWWGVFDELPDVSGVPGLERDAMTARVLGRMGTARITRIEAKEMHLSDLLAAGYERGNYHYAWHQPEMAGRLIWVVAVEGDDMPVGFGSPGHGQVAEGHTVAMSVSDALAGDPSIAAFQGSPNWPSYWDSLPDLSP